MPQLKLVERQLLIRKVDRVLVLTAIDVMNWDYGDASWQSPIVNIQVFYPPCDKCSETGRNGYSGHNVAIRRIDFWLPP